MDGCWKSSELSGAVLTAAAVLRASGMTPKQAVAEAIGLALILHTDSRQLDQEAADVAF
jgi:hypothetical protein